LSETPGPHAVVFANAPLPPFGQCPTSSPGGSRGPRMLKSKGLSTLRHPFAPGSHHSRSSGKRAAAVFADVRTYGGRRTPPRQHQQQKHDPPMGSTNHQSTGKNIKKDDPPH
jgi:hypothetical protein